MGRESKAQKAAREAEEATLAAAGGGDDFDSLSGTADQIDANDDGHDDNSGEFVDGNQEAADDDGGAAENAAGNDEPPAPVTDPVAAAEIAARGGDDGNDEDDDAEQPSGELVPMFAINKINGLPAGTLYTPVSVDERAELLALNAVRYLTEVEAAAFGV